AGQDRPKAWGPAKCESQSQNKRSDNAARFVDVMEPFVLIESIDLHDAKHMNTENDEDQPGDLVEQFSPRNKHLPNPCRRSAKQDKGDRKADDEHHRAQQYRPQKRSILGTRLELIER